MRSVEVAERAGISYRQLDHYLRKGWVTSRHDGGSGNNRDFTQSEADVIIRAGSLIAIGLAPEQAIEYARLMVEEGSDAIEVGDWIIARADSDAVVDVSVDDPAGE